MNMGCTISPILRVLTKNPSINPSRQHNTTLSLNFAKKLTTVVQHIYVSLSATAMWVLSQRYSKGLTQTSFDQKTPKLRDRVGTEFLGHLCKGLFHSRSCHMTAGSRNWCTSSKDFIEYGWSCESGYGLRAWDLSLGQKRTRILLLALLCIARPALISKPCKFFWVIFQSQVWQSFGLILTETQKDVCTTVGVGEKDPKKAILCLVLEAKMKHLMKGYLAATISGVFPLESRAFTFALALRRAGMRPCLQIGWSNQTDFCALYYSRPTSILSSCLWLL